MADPSDPAYYKQPSGSFDVGLNDNNFWGESQHVNLSADEQPTPPVRSSSKKGKKFSVHEDEVLVDAYIVISQNPVVGNEQPRGTYWEMIHDYFHANTNEESNRSQSSLQHHWAVIQEQVNRFCGCRGQILNRNQSGMTQVDKIKQALLKYQAEDKGKKAFGLTHCYEKLERTEKWKTREGHKKQKKTSDVTPGKFTSSNNGSAFDNEATSPSKEVPMERPDGRKKVKERLRQGKGSTSTGGSTVMDTLGGLFSARRDETTSREAKRQECFDIAIAIENEMEEKRLAEARAIEEKKLALEQEKIQLKRITLECEIKAEDRQIMTMDISGLDEQQLQYYKNLRAEIIARQSN